MVKFKIDYDKESDNLFLFRQEKSKGSIEIGNLILDFDSKGKLAGIEFLNATKFLKDSVAEDVKTFISKEFLSNIVKCEIESKQKNNFLFIKIILVGKKIEVSCPINTPLIKETSPALASV